MSDPMLYADPGTPFVPRTLSDLGGATPDTRVFVETPVGSGFPAPAANGDSDDEVTVRLPSLPAATNPRIVNPPTDLDLMGSNRRIDTLLEKTALHNQLNSTVELLFSKVSLSSTDRYALVAFVGKMAEYYRTPGTSRLVTSFIVPKLQASLCVMLKLRSHLSFAEYFPASKGDGRPLLVALRAYIAETKGMSAAAFVQSMAI